MFEQYHSLVKKTIEEGVLKPNRTGTDTLCLPSQSITYDLGQGFPAITTKKLAFQGAVGELLAFFRGCRSAKEFEELGCKFWTANANETESWLKSFYRAGENDLGRIYGGIWTDWRDTRTVKSDEEAQYLLEKGFELVADDPVRKVRVFEKSINQLESCLHSLMTNPDDRRILFSGWDVGKFDKGALPPCHVLYQFISLPNPNSDKRDLHLSMYMRSNDLGLGHPMNAAFCGLLVELFARLTNHTAKSVTIATGDSHVYVNHIEGLTEQLKRSHFAPPRLVISDDIKPLANASEIPGVLARIEPQHFALEGYVSHPAIKMPMAA